ncbi:DNA polymerase III subunit beta [Corynebacterium sp. 320]|uniref:DNA polymerase III subunit beta n=1 Tax=Corynebacterium TaxID=1716 RepID=UPI00125CAA2C|nr:MULTISPECIES: DNA polymerase III subunit beta [Corynebacterium]KAB1502804.1 DNA polymerase III subunit beta [Corynebacterium sp. 320]KAB1550454.1 DNA polymerase III subunit beta [Corynebacterium sp. 319]KAB1554815.1 DNA polymerase III subunit beta [Corynebacterium sp. 321]KAB3526467.1 DNA polymerase III subunit beta [Corynebacterium sp. 250]KAB3539787.1 DNA polymerase III subunit beta [Corynebacterium sp. 366]
MEPNDVKFIVPKDDLASALSWIARSLPAKPTQPVLKGIFIEASDEGLELSGFDRETSNKIRINAQVDVPGRILVAGKLAADIVGSLPDKPITMEYNSTKVLVTSGNSRFELPAMTIEDYPVLPEIPRVTGTIDPHLFSEVVGQVAIAAGKDDTLPMLTGVHLEIDGEQVVAAATDRYRLALRTFTWNPADASAQAELLIPAKTLSDAARSLDPHYTDPIEIAAGSGEDIGQDGLLGISTDTRRTTTRLLDAKFPQVRPLLPTTHKSIATVESGPLLEAIRRVALMSDRNSQIKMDFDADKVVLSAGGGEVGTATETLPCAFAGESLSIAFNPTYLRDGLSVMSTPRVFFGFTLPSRPAIMVPEPAELPQADEEGNFATPDTDFTFLLMPVRLPG